MSKLRTEYWLLDIAVGIRDYFLILIRAIFVERLEWLE